MVRLALALPSPLCTCTVPYGTVYNVPGTVLVAQRARWIGWACADERVTSVTSRGRPHPLPKLTPAMRSVLIRAVTQVPSPALFNLTLNLGRQSMRHTKPFARSKPPASESTFKPDGPHGSHTPPRPTGPTGGNATTLRAQYGGSSADSTMREHISRLQVRPSGPYAFTTDSKGASNSLLQFLGRGTASSIRARPTTAAPASTLAGSTPGMQVAMLPQVALPRITEPHSVDGDAATPEITPAPAAADQSRQRSRKPALGAAAVQVYPATRAGAPRPARSPPRKRQKPRVPAVAGAADEPARDESIAPRPCISIKMQPPASERMVAIGRSTSAPPAPTRAAPPYSLLRFAAAPHSLGLRLQPRVAAPAAQLHVIQPTTILDAVRIAVRAAAPAAAARTAAAPPLSHSSVPSARAMTQLMRAQLRLLAERVAQIHGRASAPVPTIQNAPFVPWAQYSGAGADDGTPSEAITPYCKRTMAREASFEELPPSSREGTPFQGGRCSRCESSHRGDCGHRSRSR